MNNVFFSSVKTDYCTPQHLFKQLDDEFHFVLDAAASSTNAKCANFYTAEQDALQQSWNVGGAVFCNPPYGRNLRGWLEKAYQEHQSGAGTIVMLIPSRTDTTYFHDFILGKAEIRFLRGRLKFTDETGKPFNTAPFPSMIVIYSKPH